MSNDNSENTYRNINNHNNFKHIHPNATTSNNTNNNYEYAAFRHALYAILRDRWGAFPGRNMQMYDEEMKHKPKCSEATARELRLS